MENKKIESPKTGLAVGKQNYLFLAVGLIIILVGFILMIGGGSDDPNVFNPEVFSFQRITLAPVVVLFGFVFVIYAIMKKPKEIKENQ